LRCCLASVCARLLRIWSRQRAPGNSHWRPLAGLALAPPIAIGGSIWLGREALQDRWNTRVNKSGGRRVVWAARTLTTPGGWLRSIPSLGWGLGTYAKVFQLIRPRPLEPNRQYERSYADAHPDWLQALLEVGLVGTTLLALTGILFSAAQPSPAALSQSGDCYARSLCLDSVVRGGRVSLWQRGVTFTLVLCFFCACSRARCVICARRTQPTQKPRRRSHEFGVCRSRS